MLDRNNIEKLKKVKKEVSIEMYKPSTNNWNLPENFKDIDGTLITTKAYDWAKSFEPENKNGLSSTQLRRFYHDFKALEARIEAEGFDKVYPLILLEQSKAAYASGQKKKIPDNFRKFIEEGVNSIDKSPEKFKAFMKIFEAVVGYFYGLGGGKNA